MTTPDEIDIKRWAFRVRPETGQNETGWRAWYPGTDWSVSARTEDEARKLLQTEAERRRQAGQDPFTDIHRRHLHDAIPGVYAMDNALYRELRIISAHCAAHHNFLNDSHRNVFDALSRLSTAIHPTATHRRTPVHKG